MEFESARALKEEALARYVDTPSIFPAALESRIKSSTQLLAGAVGWAGDHLPDQLGLHRLQDVLSAAVPSLGIAVSEPGDYKLAIRYPWLDETRAPLLDELNELAKEETDVQWIGPVVAATAVNVDKLRSACRPVRIGCSVAHSRGTAGTVGAFVQRGGGAPELLSCNHVLSDCGTAEANAAVLQPGPGDGGDAGHVVGNLALVYPIERTTVNVVDCALATLKTGVSADHTDLGEFGHLQGLAHPDWYSDGIARDPVAKIGRETGATQGKVTTVSLDLPINYPQLGHCQFTDLIEITGDRDPFGERGDSGSLVFTPGDSLAVGMLIAISTTRKSYVTRIDTVLSRLGAQLAT